jgi:hypothetical protein
MDYTESNVITNSVMECSQEGVCERVTTRCVDNNPCTETRILMSDREVQEEAQRGLTVSQTQELTPTDDTSSEDTSSDEDTEERSLKHFPGVNFAIILNGYDQTIIIGILILFLFIFVPLLMMKARKIK